MALIKKFRIKSFKEQETILQLDKISMFYNKRQILNNLNLKINKQEVLGMLGPNGVGKSTIFHIPISNVSTEIVAIVPSMLDLLCNILRVFFYEAPGPF